MTKLIINNHALEAIYRVHWSLDKDGNRVDPVHEDFDELHCTKCGEYYDTIGDCEKTSDKCEEDLA